MLEVVVVEKECPRDVLVLVEQAVEALVVKDRQQLLEQETLILVAAVEELA
jgi:hypothetical protein